MADRLDRILARELRIGRRQIRQLLRDGEVEVGGKPVASDGWALQVDGFDRVVVRGEIVQDRTARYVILNKPAGYVSATSDSDHPTVIDLITETWAAELHLAGRLDRATTGLLLLTNDGRWSPRVTEPEVAVPKQYLVTTEDPISRQMIDAFSVGVALPGDGVVTKPADLVFVSEHQSRLIIYEGRHHQVKRMFALFENKVIRLHRERVGELFLEEKALPEGVFRELTAAEVAGF